MKDKKLFIVVIAQQENWDSPEVLHIKAHTRDEAINIGLGKIIGIGITEEDLDEDECSVSAWEFKEEDILK